jgi:hypothetical protein
VSLIPVYGGDDFNRFKKQNSWVSRYYGHFHHPYQVAEVSPRLKWLKHLSELLLNNRLGEWLDVLCMRITIRRWHMKFKNISSAQFDLTMRSTRHVSKHHPRDFQTFVLEKMNTLRPTLQHVPK